VVPALEEAFAFIIMACELYACIFGFGLWLGGIVLTYSSFLDAKGYGMMNLYLVVWLWEWK
jgi:hypothetical protein